MKRVSILAIAGLVLFALISQPENSASWVKQIVGGLGYGAQAVITFVHNLFPS
jgi:hypothetical protein